MPIIEIIRYTSDVLKDLSQMRKIQVPDYCSCLGNFLNVGIGESWVGKRIRYLDRQKKCWQICKRYIYLTDLTKIQAAKIHIPLLPRPHKLNWLMIHPKCTLLAQCSSLSKITCGYSCAIYNFLKKKKKIAIIAITFFLANLGIFFFFFTYIYSIQVYVTVFSITMNR